MVKTKEEKTKTYKSAKSMVKKASIKKEKTLPAAGPAGKKKKTVKPIKQVKPPHKIVVRKKIPAIETKPLPSEGLAAAKSVTAQQGPPVAASPVMHTVTKEVYPQATVTPPPSKPPVEPFSEIETALPRAAVAPKVIPSKPAAVQQQPPVKKEIKAPPKPAIPEPPPVKKEVKPPLKELEVTIPISLKDLAVKLQEKPSTLIKLLMDMKMMATINQSLNEAQVSFICEKFSCTIKKALNREETLLQEHQVADTPAQLKTRPPIVTFMGHVDHGKTSLLDAIRDTKVVEKEHGGITQHIGAYRVMLPHGEITFLDTPGHEAFTAMRARGARITDIVVLVVAADDGVMPQTKEAVDHARAAGVSIIVALNKIDKPQADPDLVKKQLSAINLLPEDWGGKIITVPVSAKTGKGIDELLELILLEAQMLELKANPQRPAKGVVVEAKLSKGRGPVATLLVQNGTLHAHDSIIVGEHYAKIRAMFNARGQVVREAGPAVPVEVLGLSGVPEAGEQFYVVKDEKQAKELAGGRQEKERQLQMKSAKKISLEDLYAQILEGKLKELKIIVKSDVQGSLEAIKDTLQKLNISEIKLDIIHEGVGSINSSDVLLASASNALILGFNVTPDDPARELIAKEGVDARTYNIIYELANDIKAALEGMLEPKLKKVFLGKVEVRKVFRLSRSGTVAGCFVSKGKVARNSQIAVMRNGEPIFEGTISALKRFKDDVREVLEGFECGITINGFDAFQEGDVLEAFDVEKIARKL